MKDFKDFSDFKKAAIKELNKNKGLGSIIESTLHGLVSGVNVLEYTGSKEINSVPDISTVMFDEFLEENFRNRFEKNKHNQSYVRMLITEAVEQFQRKCK